MRSTTRNLCLTTTLTAALVACGGGQNASGSAGGGTGDSARGAAAAAKQLSVRTAPVPADPCGWIPVSEVEAAVGKLAAPPTQQDGCRYTLVVPEANYEADPSTFAVTLSVDVSGSIAGEMGAAAAVAHLKSWPPPQQRGGQDSTADSGDAEGWDAVLPAPYGFSGRIGHVRISVLGQAPDVPRSSARALANRVRDGLQDLPFPAITSYQVVQPGPELKDPCTLLTRADAEAVLGLLVVDPYRTSSEHPPLALGEGNGCAFYTAGHHVFSIIPTWRDGQRDFNLNKGIGALMSQVLPQELVVLKGPWDEAQVSGTTGALLFLKGDRLLEVHYKTSSTDMRGAVKLAAQAIGRMTS